jgi:hypothetical protein
MQKDMKIILMFFVIACIVFSAGCTGNTQSTNNQNKGASGQQTNQPTADGNMTHHQRLHMNGSGHWNGTGRPHFNGSGRPHFNGSGRPYWNDSGNVTDYNSSNNISG